MGFMTRQQGVTYVITSDHVVGETDRKRAPRFRSDLFHVWTGAAWSTTGEEAISFNSLDEADEYVRANYATLSAKSAM